jgi:cellobiose epimerase
MTGQKKMKEFAKKILTENILSYWLEKTVDNENGGFFGRVTDKNIPDTKSDKGLILNARILWTFSCAARILSDDKYKKAADRAYDFILENFYDPIYRGFYWKVDYEGKSIDTKKQIYAQAFVIYALSEYYKINPSQICLEKAVETFNAIEEHSFDRSKGGYFEAFDREWKPLGDLRLSDKDMNEKKTMNTHLHILEGYTNLYRINRSGSLKTALNELLDVFYDHIIDKNDHHFNLFFDENWNIKSNKISFGHDIEGSWLLLEAAEVLEISKLVKKFKDMAVKMAEVCIPGINSLGGLSQDIERGAHMHDGEVEWWVQAEAVVGYINAYQITGNEKYLNLAKNLVQYIDKNVIDHTSGEWHGRLSANGKPVKGEDKVGFWKCPYHNSRMCFEIIGRL